MSDTTTNNASTTKTVNKELTQNNDEVSLPELFLRVFFFSSNVTRSDSTFVSISKQVKKTIVETENKNEKISSTTETKEEEKKIVTKVCSLFFF